MRFVKICITIFLFVSPVFGGELLEVAKMVALTEGQVLEQEAPEVQKECGDEAVLAKRKEPITVDAEIEMTFEVKAYKGLEATPERKFIPFENDGFDEKWIKLISAENDSQRSETVSELCKGMSQEEAMAFAGYIGRKNSNVYDYERVSSSGNEQARDEAISIDEYYAVHRNNEGLGDPNGRKKMGICGDAATLVADFLSKCNFKCEDIDIVSYRTTSGGHQVVSTRGEDGSYYTANWSSVERDRNTPVGDIDTPNTNIAVTSPSIELWDCNGKPKGKVTTPLGTLLMLAHEDPEAISLPQDYQEVSFVAKNVGGLDEVKVKAFKASASNGQKLSGIGARISKQMGTKNNLFSMEIDGSIILAKAQKDLQIDNFGTMMNLEQTILSPHARIRTDFNPIRFENFQAGIFAEAKSTVFYMDNVENLNGELADNSTNADAMTRVRSGVTASAQTDNFRFEATGGVGGEILRNFNQQGSAHINGEVVERKQEFKANEIFANGRVDFVSKNGNDAHIQVRYRDMYLLDRSVIEVQAGKKFGKNKFNGGVSIIKNPGKETINALSLAYSRQFQLRKNYVEVSGGVKYLIIKDSPSEKLLNVSVAYKF